MHPNAFVRLFAEEATYVLREMVTYVGPAQRNGHCLNATRICIDTLDKFGIKATPLSVEMMAWNREYDVLTRRLGRMPTAADWEGTTAWAIGTDTRVGANDQAFNAWPGHLVAVVQDHVVDCSAGQFSRPQKGITVPDVFIVANATARFLKGKGKCAAVNNVEGSALWYMARPKDRSYVGLSGFQRHVHNTEIVIEIAQRMLVRAKRQA
jgi:hypothetical protein